MDNILSLRYKISYGAAGFGEATAYCLLSTFLMFYLTTIAEIPPAIAGTIIALGSVWDVVTCPFFGFISDNCTSRMGKRRPFVLIGCIPFTLLTMLLFTFIDAGLPVKVAYYMFMMLLFWTAYTCFYVPYMALGAELTDDYDERTSLRSYTSVFNSLGAIIGAVVPTIMVDYLCSGGFSAKISWQLTALLIGLISGLGIFFCFLGSKGRDKGIKKEEQVKFDFKHMIMEYIDVLKIKPLQFLLAASIICLTGITVSNSARMYFLTYNMGFSAKQISFTLFMASVIGLGMPPIINAFSKRFDRRIIYIVFIIFGSLGSFSFKFIGVTGYATLYVMITMYCIINMTYWQLMPTILYDVGEYDKFTSGKDRVGAIMSIQSVSEAIAEALGVQVLGIILQIVGFDGTKAVQTDFVIGWIENSMMVVPVVFTIISCIFIWKYPITREVYEKIKQGIAEREVDEE